MSRGRARRELSTADLEQAMSGTSWNRDKADVLLDEAPLAYKDIDQVMEDQRDLVAGDRTRSSEASRAVSTRSDAQGRGLHPAAQFVRRPEPSHHRVVEVGDRMVGTSKSRTRAALDPDRVAPSG